MEAPKRKPNLQSSNSSKHNRKKPEQFDDSEYMSRYNSFTSLNQSLSNILMQVKARVILTAPLRIKGQPNKRDMSKYCHYHHENRHVTNDC